MRTLHKILLSILSTLFLLPAGPAPGAEEMTGDEKLRLIDVFQLEHASDPQVSPNGRPVVYVRNFMDITHDRRRSNLWLIGNDGANHRPITSGNQSDSLPRWSPDGKRLAYVSDESGSKQIYCRWMDSGQTAKLTQLTSDPEHLVWSPDGRMLAFTMFVPEEQKPFVELPAAPPGAQWAEPARVIRKTLYRQDGKGYVQPGYRQVFVLPADGGTPRPLTSGPYHHEGPLCWSPDVESLFFSANRSPNWEYEPRNSEIYEVTLSDRRITALTDRQGPDHTPVVSPDGRQIAWLGYHDERKSYQLTRLSVMDRDGSNRRVITSKFDRGVKAPVWSSDGKGLFVQFDDAGTSRIGLVSLAGEVTTVANSLGGVTIGRPYASGSFSVAADGTVAYTQSRPEYRADVAVVHAGTGETQRITRLNDDLLKNRQLAATEEFWFPSSFDGRRIQAWIVKPPGFDPKKKYPLILEIHGGPFANYGDRFSAEIQLYAAAGYVVLYVNPRGSTGYGEKFTDLIHHDYPGHDYDDLMSAVDAVIQHGSIDEDNLFVTGGSGGGILTAWIVGKTGRFRAAVAAKPVVNWYSFVLTTDNYPLFNGYWFPGAPWDNVEHYLRRSPLSLAGNVTTPTMLLTGESDHRTPISESEQFYQALKLRKVDTALVRIPGASHGIVKRPSRLMVKVAHILKWFEIHRTSD